jgi:hypothetical protein
MKKLQNELHSISKTISELAIRVEALADNIIAKSTKMIPTNSASSPKLTTNAVTNNSTTILYTEKH